MSKTIEDSAKRIIKLIETPTEQDRLAQLITILQERDRIAYERGHTDALRTLPVYETNNITSDK